MRNIILVVILTFAVCYCAGIQTVSGFVSMEGSGGGRQLRWRF